MAKQTILKMEHITKTFPGVRAVDDVTFEVEKGEIHALLGHNGAGKSTLVKILSGAYRKDEGKIFLDGSEVEFSTPSDALNSGIGMVYQELDLIPHLSGSENIFLGQKRFLNKMGFIDRKKRMRESEKLIAGMGVPIDLGVPVKDLSISKQQLIAIVKAISRDAKIIIFDEPTAALNDSEVEKLFEIMRRLTGRGIALILITHRLDEVFQMADRVTMMRDGKKLSTDRIEDTTMQRVVSAMTGNEEGEQGSGIAHREINGKVVLECRGLTSGTAFSDICFDLHEGEVLGITGLIGCGSTEIAKAIYGAYPVDSGTVKLENKLLKPMNSRYSAQHGIAYVSEDRKSEGLILCGQVKHNISITILDRISKAGIINFKKENELARNMIERLSIRVSGTSQLAGTLSGGNQQKVVLSKWLLKDVKVFIMCEPTRGIDVGAKKEIHGIIRTLAENGMSVLVVSSEIEEIMDTCDRTIVLYEGKLKAEAKAKDVQKATLMNLMYGVG